MKMKLLMKNMIIFYEEDDDDSSEESNLNNDDKIKNNNKNEYQENENNKEGKIKNIEDINIDINQIIIWKNNEDYENKDYLTIKTKIEI